MRRLYIILYIIPLLLLPACNEYTPKPMGYPRIEREAYKTVKVERPEFSFLYPSDTKIEYIKPESKDKLWFNIHYPLHLATIHCTYLPTDEKKLKGILDDSHQFAYSHAIMAEAISQAQYVDSTNNIFGLIYDIKGSVASPIQFYVTNNTSKILMGSMYFEKPVNPDSIAPVVAFIREDIVCLMQSIDWN